MREAEEVSKAMQEQDDNKQFKISERLEDLRREHRGQGWEASFRDYFELITQNSGALPNVQFTKVGITSLPATLFSRCRSGAI